ncbi:MAG: hypothetical protein IKL07_03210 [Clostridium sp.]|nr:hypothetical protein [Clostridium sp.]
MIWFGKKRDAYTFSDKVHPKEGIASVILGVMLLLGYLSLFLITSKKQGGLLVGVLGLLLFLLAWVGFVIAVKAMKKEDIRYQFPIIGIILNGIIVVISVILYFRGLASNIGIG